METKFTAIVLIEPEIKGNESIWLNIPEASMSTLTKARVPRLSYKISEGSLNSGK